MTKKGKGKKVSASEKQYRDLARKVEQKIKRVKKNYGIDLTNELKIPDFSSLSSKERTNQKELMRSFTNRANTKYQFVKNENDVVLSKKEINEVNRQTQITQMARAKKIKERAKDTGRPEGKMTLKQIVNKYKGENAMGIGMPGDFNVNAVTRRGYTEKLLKRLKETATDEWLDNRDKTLYDNYINSLREAFNSDANSLIETLEGISPKHFAALYENEDLDFELFYADKYTPTEDKLASLHQLENTVNNYIKILDKRKRR